MRIRAFNLETRGPDDVEGVRRLLDRGTIRADEVIAVIGKTEGNGGRNDFTRALAIMAFEQLLAPRRRELDLTGIRAQVRIRHRENGR